MTRTTDPTPMSDTSAPTPQTGPAPQNQTSPAPHPAPPEPAAPASTTTAPRVLVVDADRALFGLIQEWLHAEGCAVFAQGRAVDATDGGSAERFDLVIVDLPYPRDSGVDLVARLSKRHPMTPILALSPTFFARIECCGPVARALGVACVVPTPVSRQALVGAVRRVLPAPLPETALNSAR